MPPSWCLASSGPPGGWTCPPGLDILSDPLVMLAAGAMYAVEFFADKVPGLDSVWDTLHTFIRIPAGAMLAAGAIGDVGPGAELAAALMGGGLAAATHAAKSGTRVLINTSPEPFTNWAASITEDVGVFAGLWTAVMHPAVFLVLLAVFLALLVWLLPKLWRGIKRVFGAHRPPLRHQGRTRSRHAPATAGRRPRSRPRLSVRGEPTRRPDPGRRGTRGMRVYLVGGAVRDRLLGRPARERDFVVVGATAAELLAQGYTQVGRTSRSSCTRRPRRSMPWRAPSARPPPDTTALRSTRTRA